MQPQRFNVFQQIMRLWDEVHPYNAAQVLRLCGAPNADAISTAWGRAMSSLGLGDVHVDGGQFHHEPRQGESATVSAASDGTRLEDFISDEMNRPFPSAGSFCPFRPFILREDGGFYAGVIYHHWIADSVSIRMVLREWFMQMHDPANARQSPLRFPRGGYWHFFGPQHGGWGLDEAIWSTLRFATRFGRVRRVESDVEDFSVRCSFYQFPDGLIDDLRHSAHRQNATLNDVYLASMAEACDRHGAPPRTHPRDELALGTIVDLRQSCAQELDDVFGLFLGFTNVIVRPDALADWPRLLRTIAQQTAWQKQCRLPQASLVRMAAAVAEARLLSPREWVRFYQDHLPMAAGISNVNLTRTWAANYYPRILLDYLRFSPTGPNLPVVFTPTSLGTTAHLGLTYRPALIDPSGADTLADTFIQRLIQVAGRFQLDRKIA